MSLTYPCIYCTEDLHCEKYAEPGYESWCVLGPCKAQTRSHSDMLRCMTDKKMAEWFVRRDQTCPPGRKTTFDERCQDEKCYQCWLEWLTAAEEGE